MKTVYVVAGNTFPKKEDLKSLQFRYLPDNKIWVKWTDSDRDSIIKETVDQWDSVSLFVTAHDPFVGTCVDPLNGDMNVTKCNYDWRNDLTSGARTRLQSLYQKPKKKSITKHAWNGKRAELNKYAARSVQSKVNETLDEPIEYLYRNIRITEVIKETAKAVMINFEFFGGIARSCHVCGAALDTEVSRSCGIGPVCARRMGLPRPTKDNATIVLAQIEERVGQIGEIGPVWVPKSCIEIME